MCKSGSQAGPCKRNTLFSAFFLCLDFPKIKKDFQEDVEEKHQFMTALIVLLPTCFNIHPSPSYGSNPKMNF